ncbi:MAG: succinylglutamate desuccinylase/aspartoacylase family protein [Pseudobdellovibrio sp.]|nr:succinylglutamate desuccinylase/aspartoacylase family protein [Pseudobdellovibrio sp.]
MTQHEAELEKFKTLHNRFRVQPGYQSIDLHGFTMSEKPDILFTALVHGNEVIGLQVLNLFLEKTLKSNHKAPYTFAVLLCNVPAYDKNQRFINKDLNRSFQAPIDTPKIEKGQEYYRAQQVEDVIQNLKPRFIIDLHQTTEPTLSPFFMLPEEESLVRSASVISKEWPIITFDPSGFSKDGKTLMEFARGEKIPALVIEISQNGFDLNLAKLICEQLFYLNAELIIAPPKKDDVSYFKITQHLTKFIVGSELMPGFQNLQSVKENDILGITPAGNEYFCPADGVFIFPKYGSQAEVSTELGLIATPRNLLQLKADS